MKLYNGVSFQLCFMCLAIEGVVHSRMGDSDRSLRRINSE